MIVDNTCMQLVMKPEQFDVIVTTNLFGDIISDLCAGLVGGLGLAPGANIGTDAAIFEAVHGSAPDIAGKGIANPCALLLGAAQMLDHLGQPEKAERLRAAIIATLEAKDSLTPDLGGRATRWASPRRSPAACNVSMKRAPRRPLRYCAGMSVARLQLATGRISVQPRRDRLARFNARPARSRSRWRDSVARLQLRQQAQDLEVQPDQRHQQAERGVPLHVLRRALLDAVLDEVEVEHQVQRRDHHHHG